MRCNYTYSSFGELDGRSGSTENTYRFAGEQYDENVGDYYLRQRYYNADTGRFTRRDSYEGRLPHPQTIHKYLYTHANPVNSTDPTGFYTSNDGYAVEDGVEEAYRLERPVESAVTTFGQYATGRFGFNMPLLSIKPDILNFFGVLRSETGLFNEIKPLSPSGISDGISQITQYFLDLMPYNFKPDVAWHNPTNPLILPNVSLTSGAKDVVVFNIGGILFYTDDSSRRMRQQITAISRNSFGDAIEGAKDLLYVAANSQINELARSKYLIESAQNTASVINFTLLAATVAAAAALTRTHA